MNKKKLTIFDFKALLFDIDRTLTNTKGEVSPKTIKSLEELHKKGFQIGVCSGRGVASIKNKILPLFPKNSLHITTGGSELVNYKGEAILDNPIDVQFIKKLKRYVAIPKDDGSLYEVVFMKNDAMYAKEPVLSNLKNHPWRMICKNLSEMSNDGVGNIYITNVDNKILDYISNNKNVSFKYMINNKGNPYVDITAKGIDKSVTLKKWSQQTGITLDKIIGFGDSANDIEFLKACGFSVAMGNAVKEVKNIADRVIGHTDDNALAKYLSKIINGENL